MTLDEMIIGGSNCSTRRRPFFPVAAVCRGDQTCRCYSRHGRGDRLSTIGWDRRVGGLLVAVVDVSSVWHALKDTLVHLALAGWRAARCRTGFPDYRPPAGLVTVADRLLDAEPFASINTSVSVEVVALS